MASSNTPNAELVLEGSLSGIQKTFRTRIILSFLEIRRRFAQAIYSDEAYDAIGISAGKLCEALLRFLQQELTGTHTPFGASIGNFADQCRKLEQTPTTAGVESLR